MQKFLQRIAHQLSRSGSSHQVERTLRRAEGLIAENKWREAIEFLTLSNREQAHSDIEKVLVDLFLQAARSEEIQHSASPGLVISGAENVALENAPYQIPEIPAHQLCAAALTQAIRDHGHLIVRNFFPGASAQVVRESIDRALVARVNSAGGRRDLQRGFALVLSVPAFSRHPRFLLEP